MKNMKNNNSNLNNNNSSSQLKHPANMVGFTLAGRVLAGCRQPEGSMTLWGRSKVASALPTGALSSGCANPPQYFINRKARKMFVGFLYKRLQLLIYQRIFAMNHPASGDNPALISEAYFYYHPMYPFHPFVSEAARTRFTLDLAEHLTDFFETSEDFILFQSDIFQSLEEEEYFLQDGSSINEIDSKLNDEQRTEVMQLILIIRVVNQNK